MTYENFINTISENVAKDLNDNLENILKFLIEGLPQSPCLTEEQFRLVKNAIVTSVQVSTQITFSYLDSLGVINHENLEEHFEPPHLELINGGLSAKTGEK